MYYNNIHIAYYLEIGAIGLIIGFFMSYISHRLEEKKKIFSLDFFGELKQGLPYSYLFMLLTAISYIGILYYVGFQNNFVKILDLAKYMAIIPMLISVFVIDMKKRIIPNRLTLTMFEVGLIFTFLYGISNINIAADMLLGMLAGAGIFAIITLVGGFLSGKEAMGLGDVKLMGALGLYFGVSAISAISILSFFIGAIIGIFILIVRAIARKKDSYIPFGPFIVIAAIILIFVPADFIYTVFLDFCERISLFLIS